MGLYSTSVSHCKLNTQKVLIDIHAVKREVLIVLWVQ